MKGATLLLLLVLAVTLWIGCLGQERGDLESTPTASNAGQGEIGVPVGTEPPCHLGVDVTFSEPPLINRTVTATVGVFNPNPSNISNAQIVLLLYRRWSPDFEGYNTTPLWQAILWNGTIPRNGNVEASSPFRIEGPGYYYARVIAGGYKPSSIKGSPPSGFIVECGVTFVRLDVSENQTIVKPGLR